MQPWPDFFCSLTGPACAEPVEEENPREEKRGCFWADSAQTIIGNWQASVLGLLGGLAVEGSSPEMSTVEGGSLLTPVTQQRIPNVHRFGLCPECGLQVSTGWPGHVVD